MYVRAARNRDELWLLDRIEELELDEAAFRSRDYVIAVDEETGEKGGFGRLRVHKATEDEEYCELTSIGVLEGWKGQGVGAHVVERLVENAGDEGFEEVYAFVENVEPYEELGFVRIDEDDLPEPLSERLAEKRGGVAPDAVPMRLALGAFTMPNRHREAFKAAGSETDEAEVEETPEDFGIDPDSATYKYDTGR